MSNTRIVVCGKQVEIGTRVVLWNEPGGFNAYDTTRYVHQEADRKTGKEKQRVVSGVRYSSRSRVRRIKTIEGLRNIVSQFFIHHDGLYRASTTFNVLHVERGLSCHFLLDDDGTLYQTLDLVEKAWHGGNCNPMSVGIEIASRANAGKYPNAYNETNQKRHRVGPRDKRYDIINGNKLLGFEYNDAQYKALIRLGMALVQLFPLIGGDKADFPRTASGRIIKATLASPKKHKGFICHYNVTRSKIDPISFDHDRFVIGVRTKNENAPSTFAEQLKVDDPLDTWLERQQALLSLGYNPGRPDNILGPKTKRALKAFQADHGLVPDGLWGPNTRGKMLSFIKE